MATTDCHHRNAVSAVARLSEELIGTNRAVNGRGTRTILPALQTAEREIAFDLGETGSASV